MLAKALHQAKEARLQILAVMASAIAEPRAEVAASAPKIVSMEIPIDKIGEVIGPEGQGDQHLQQETGADITVDDDGMVGTVTIGAKDAGAVAEAKRRISLILDPPSAEIGEVYSGKVVNLTKFGAFVNVLPGRDGLLHISKLSPLAGGRRVGAVEDVLTLGQPIEVRVDDIDQQGKVSLSLASVPPRRRSGRRGAAPREPVVTLGRAIADRHGEGVVRLLRGRLRGRAGGRPGRPRPGHAGRRRGDARAATGTGAVPGRRAGVERRGGRSRRHHRDAASRAAPGHRDHGRGPLGRGRVLGRQRLARRAGRDRRGLALPGAPLVQGDARRAAPCSIAEALDEVGGDCNAYTTKEYTVVLRSAALRAPRASGSTS